jgi:hypothetical protein
MFHICSVLGTAAKRRIWMDRDCLERGNSFWLNSLGTMTDRDGLWHLWITIKAAPDLGLWRVEHLVTAIPHCCVYTEEKEEKEGKERMNNYRKKASHPSHPSLCHRWGNGGKESCGIPNPAIIKFEEKLMSTRVKGKRLGTLFNCQLGSQHAVWMDGPRGFSPPRDESLPLHLDQLYVPGLFIQDR